MKTVLLSISFLCLTCANTTTLIGKKLPVTQKEKYFQHYLIIAPILSEAARINGEHVLNLKEVNSHVFFALLRDTTRMVTSESTSLAEITRLIQLCDFLKAGSTYNTNAITLEEIIRDYQQYPENKPMHIERLKALVIPLMNPKK